MKKLTFVIVLMLLATITLANPIPWPPPANMPLEDMYVQIQPAGDTLHALFTGDFTFTYISQDVNSMLFPVPPDANNIGVWMDDIPLGWEWSSELYPTILPEMPTIPMIEWPGPFPEQGAVFTVDYEHDLIKRPAEFVFFYAVGTGKYFPTYEKTTTAYFDILLPAGFAVAGVWLDDTTHEYEVIDSHLMVTVQSHFGPIINDLIVSLVPTTLYVATDGNDVTGDGSINNPFRTIQKGIDTAVDGHTVVVAAGTYYENIRVKDGVTVQGSGADATIINGGENGHVVVFNMASGTISGFTITKSGEDPRYSAGVFTSQSSITIADNIITGNAHGISVSSNSAAVITGNRIENNVSIYFGHGIEVFDSCATITNNIIANNGNWAGIDCSYSSLSIVNNVVFSNSHYGLWLSTLSTIQIIYNNIITQNEWGIMAVGGEESPVSQLYIAYNDVWNNFEADYWSEWGGVGIPGGSEAFAPQPGTGEISEDPLLGNAANGDYHLQSSAGRWDPNSESWVTDANTSPCIDAGNPGCPPGSEPLPNGSRINMGAYGGTPTASKSPADWRSIADLTNDWAVDFNDLAVFVDYWLDSGQCIPGDLNHNGSVDFNDFAIFSQQWLDTPAVGPAMTYQIDGCDPETKRGLAVVSQPGELRFSVNVRGSYIHFEDTMVANCCPDTLGLEMTVADSLITIYETEYTPGGCWCICDYPIVAILGPFEPGVYILEVYEDQTGFIGSTTVIIE